MVLTGVKILVSTGPPEGKLESFTPTQTPSWYLAVLKGVWPFHFSENQSSIDKTTQLNCLEWSLNMELESCAFHINIFLKVLLFVFNSFQTDWVQKFHFSCPFSFRKYFPKELDTFGVSDGV